MILTRFITHLSSNLTKFFFIRHGKTLFNKEKRYTGLLNISLSNEGIEEVNRSLPLLEKQNISIIYSSPLLRAMQTAEIIAKHLNIPIVIIDEFKERSFGSFSGKRKLQFKKKYFPDGQSFYKYKQTTLKGFFRANIYNNSLIVAHSGTYKILAKYYEGRYIKNSIENATPVSFKLKNANANSINTWELSKLT